MSGAERKAIRQAAAAALAADARLGSYTQVSAWSVLGLDPDALPAYGVATPDESRELDAHSMDRNQCQLIVAIKRTGGEDIEDEMDEDADAASAAVHAALRDGSRGCDLTRTQSKVDAQGTTRAGSVELVFSVTYWEDFPA